MEKQKTKEDRINELLNLRKYQRYRRFLAETWMNENRAILYQDGKYKNGMSLDKFVKMAYVEADTLLRTDKVENLIKKIKNKK